MTGTSDPDPGNGGRSGPARDPDDLALTEEQVASFGALGLDQDALRTYQLLLLTDGWSHADLARQLDVTDRCVEVALEVLAGVGLVVPSQEKVDTLRPVTPRVGLHRLIEERDQTLRQSQERLSQTRAATNRLVDLVEQHDTRQRSSLEQVAGRDEISDRISEMLARASEEVLTMLTMLPSPEALTTARRGDAALLERGVETRMLVLAGHVRRSPEYAAHLCALSDLGADVRVAASLPTRLILVDRAAAILPSDPDDPASGVTIVRHHSVIRLMRETFESIWRHASPLGADEVRTDRWTPTGLELEVIRLLGLGNKDEAIARRVGMSLRSVRRLISQISQELGSNSRFELGLLCGARGWTTPAERA